MRKSSILIFIITVFTGIAHANLFENSSFALWCTKSVRPANGVEVTLSYPNGWSFQTEGEAEGVTSWGNPVFEQTPYTVGDAAVIEINGYGAAYEQFLYQEFTLEPGLYSFAAQFKGKELGEDMCVAMAIKTPDGESLLDEPLTRLPDFGSEKFRLYRQSVFIPSHGTYRVGVMACNETSEGEVQLVAPSFERVDLSESNRLVNGNFVLWTTKTVKPTQSSAVTLSYPEEWSFVTNGEAEGVTKWGNTIFTHTPYHIDGSDVIEIKGYATAYDQTLYQEVALEPGSYLFSGLFKGGEISATTHISMEVRAAESDKLVYSSEVSDLSEYNSSTFTPCVGTVDIATAGSYRVGVRAVNTDSECWVQMADLFLKKSSDVDGISRIVNANGKNYLEYKGSPRLLYGIEARIDDYLGSYNPYGNAAKIKTIYQYFQKAKEAGFRELAIPVPWYWIERGDGNFDFSLVDTLVTQGERYSMKIQLIWFGSNVCGWSSVPDYISENTTLFPRLAIEGEPLDLSNATLINRELRAFSRLMDFLYRRDHANVVYMIQVENEPDHKGSTNELWAGGQKSAALQMIDMLGQVVHSSALSMVTRVNFTGWTTSADEMRDYPGIDIIGRDVYTDRLDNFLSASSYFDYAWNLNHTPENGAQYKNIVNLALSAFERGDGYMHYELRTTDWRTNEYDLGLYRSTTDNEWVERDGTQMVPYSLSKTDPDIEVDMQEVKDFHEMIYKADRQIAVSPANRNAAFNLGNAAGAVDETKKFGEYTVTFTSSNGGEAFAMQTVEGDIILMSLKDNGSFKFSSLPSSSVLSIGYFDDDNTWVETASRQIRDNMVVLQAKEVARIRTGDSASLSQEPVEGRKPLVYGCQGNLVVDSSDGLYLQVYTLDGRCVLNREIEAGRNEINMVALKGNLLLVKAMDCRGNFRCSKVLL